MLRAEWKGEEGSRRRKLYTITASGRRRLEKELQGWQSFAANVNYLLGIEPAI
jgi:DNA-binding PadR family transcriptional regulator